MWKATPFCFEYQREIDYSPAQNHKSGSCKQFRPDNYTCIPINLDYSCNFYLSFSTGAGDVRVDLRTGRSEHRPLRRDQAPDEFFRQL